jgi:hypothetical protein
MMDDGSLLMDDFISLNQIEVLNEIEKEMK